MWLSFRHGLRELAQMKPDDPNLGKLIDQLAELFDNIAMVAYLSGWTYDEFVELHYALDYFFVFECNGNPDYLDYIT